VVDAGDVDGRGVADGEFVVSGGESSVIITIIGIGLVQLGVWVSHKRAAKKGVV